MGIIDRAFGVDKNSALADGLSFHWLAVSSHYENHLKRNEMAEVERRAMENIVNLSKQMSNIATASKKGFGFLDFDVSKMTSICAELMLLHKEISVETEKPRWLVQAVSATLDILNGEKRIYQRNQYWFSD